MPHTVSVPAEHPDIVGFTQALLTEMVERYGDDPEEIARTDPDARWVLLLDENGDAIGCGALQHLRKSIPGAPAEHGEIKRVYVVPGQRGLGRSRLLMAALTELAVEGGFTWLQLETGTEQPEALALYERSGWMRVPNYGQYVEDPRSVCFGLAVGATTSS